MNSTSPFQSFDPFREVAGPTVPTVADCDLYALAERAWDAGRLWSRIPLTERCDLLRRFAEALEGDVSELAKAATLEMGKPLAEAEAELAKCARVCRYVAENAARVLARRRIEVDGATAWIDFEPLGPVVAIMPWNYPYWQFFRFGAAALAAGNSILFKPAPCTPRSAQLLLELLVRCELPNDLVQVAWCTHEQTERLIHSRRVAAVTFTGSTRAGKRVASVAASALKPCVTELGGQDPFLVCADADLARAAAVGAQSRCQNAGQSCIAAKRFLVHRERRDSFVAKLCQELGAWVMGDPLDPGTTLGPIAQPEFRERARVQLRALEMAGARQIWEHPGAPDQRRFCPPQVWEIPASVAAPAEELFAPVALIQQVGDDDEAVAVANASDWGLGATVWSESLERATKIAAALEAGQVTINGMMRSDPAVPIGGVKDSGNGKELGELGMTQFAAAKSVLIDP